MVILRSRRPRHSIANPGDVFTGAYRKVRSRRSPPLQLLLNGLPRSWIPPFLNLRVRVRISEAACAIVVACGQISPNIGDGRVSWNDMKDGVVDAVWMFIHRHKHIGWARG